MSPPPRHSPLAHFVLLFSSPENEYGTLVPPVAAAVSTAKRRCLWVAYFTVPWEEDTQTCHWCHSHAVLSIAAVSVSEVNSTILRLYLVFVVVVFYSSAIVCTYVYIRASIPP